MSVILDVLAYNTFMNNFYTNMALGEMFLDTAQLRPSVISHCKELNYLPRSYRSSAAKIKLAFSPNDDPAFIPIPKYTQFTGKIDSITYNFFTNETYTVLPVDNTYELSDIDIYEGSIETELFQVKNGTRFIISNKNVDTDSIAVKIYESSDTGAASEDYTFVPNLFGVSRDDKVFYIQASEYEKYEITFGNDVFGREPLTNEVIEIKYRISSGEAPNGIQVFSSVSNISGYTPTVTTENTSEYGAENESIESIKFYAPKSIQIQERAITESDYENLLKNEFAEIQAVSVYSGGELVPPKYGRVIVAVDVAGADGVSDNNKRRYTDFLTERCCVAIEPIVIDPEFMYVQLISTVRYNTNRSDKSSSDISTLARNAIQTYSDTYLNDFKKNVRYSRLIRAIDDADTAIVSNDTDMFMIIDINLLLNTPTNFAFTYKNSLKIDHELSTGEDIFVHEPAIKSSNFTYNGQEAAFIQDDGIGTLKILTITTDGFQILNPNLGTVNYETGQVSISNLDVEAFSGSAIKMYGRPRELDIIGPKERIISIRPVDVSVTIESVTS